MNKHRIPQWRLISELVGSKDVKMHTTSVFEWEGLLFEVLGKEQVKGNRVLPTHYLPIDFEGKSWRVRELGKKSKLYKEIKNGTS